MVGRLGAAAGTRARLTVVLITEEFRTDYLWRNLDAFGAGGFRRLLDEAAFFPDCRLRSTTFTSSALATLAAGCYPEMHGIVADRWFDRATRQIVAAEGGRLEATTVFERETDARDRFFAMAATEESASLLAPRGAAASFHKRSDGTFSTGSKEPPKWLAAFETTHSPEGDHNRPWVARGAAAGAPPLRTLRYDAANPEDFNRLLAGSPFAQSTELALVRELIAQESLGWNGIDTVAVVLDSLGKLGSEVGAVSPLVDDEVLALDADLAQFLDWLDKRGGSYNLVFTAAHGASAVPPAASYVRGEEIAGAIEKALAAEFAKGRTGLRFVEAYVYPFLYLRTERFNASDLPRARELAGRAAMATGHVASFLTADGVCSHPGEWQERLRNSSYGSRSGDVVLIYHPGLVEDAGGVRGVSYGSPYGYDAQVPLFLKGPPFMAGRFDHTVEMVDIAPTLSAAAGTTLPSSATGRTLGEAFGEGVG